MNQILVRIESIFAIGLAKLLLENGKFGFVSQNKEFKETFDFPMVENPHDVNISDLDRRVGILVKGIPQAVEEIEEIIRENLTDSIVFGQKVQQDAIYIARVTKFIYRKKLAIVDLDGKNKGIMFNIFCKEGDKILVQIKDLPTEIDKLPICTNEIALPGSYCILEFGANFVRVSKKIQGNERRRLHTLGKKLLPNGFGIIIRTSARSISESDLGFEINKLIELWERIDNEFNDSDDPKRLISGEKISRIRIGYASKTKLDELRSEIKQTIPNFHLYKGYSQATGFTLDYLQQFLDRFEESEIEDRMLEMIRNRDFPINNHVRCDLTYLDGSIEEINLGEINHNESYFQTDKILEFPMEEIEYFEVKAGDVMKVAFQIGKSTIHFSFYNKENNEKIGEWIKITAPLDISYRGRVRGIDMGMNLFKEAGTDHVVHTVNENARDNIVEYGVISKNLDDKLAEVVMKATKALENNEENILVDLE